MENAKQLSLTSNTVSSQHRLFAIVAIGLLESIQAGCISTDDAHAYMFNPLTLRLLSEVNMDPTLIDLWNQTLFLEDLEPLMSEDQYQQKITNLKEKMIEVVMKYNREKAKYHHWARGHDD